ncbi:MAG: PBSX family phage terminase large subunit [Planctomycetes bacterium]|nr:PBSX family phage terminase large subunit [Planctomycetota bacterium]
MQIDFSNLPKHITEAFHFMYNKTIDNSVRYVILKGGRGSGKSRNVVPKLIKDTFYNSSKPNILVVQKTFASIKDASYENIVQSVDRLGLSDAFYVTESPMRVRNNFTKARFIFRGLDKPEKLKSIEGVGAVIIEEADLLTERDFEILDLSIRGADDIKIYLLFNPCAPTTFIKKEFIDKNRDDTFIHHSTYLDNPYLGKSFYAKMERLKEENPKMYEIDGLGNFGVVEGLIYSNFEVKTFDESALIDKPTFGLDWGWVHPATVIKSQLRGNTLYIVDEICESYLENDKLWQKIKAKGWKDELITADCAEPKSIATFAGYGAHIRGTNKKSATVVEQIKIMQGFKIVVHPRCKETIKELYSYKWKVDKNGDSIEKPVDVGDDCLDAVRYSINDVLSRSTKVQTGNSFSLWG